MVNEVAERGIIFSITKVRIKKIKLFIYLMLNEVVEKGIMIIISR